MSVSSAEARPAEGTSLVPTESAQSPAAMFSGELALAQVEVSTVGPEPDEGRCATCKKRVDVANAVTLVRASTKGGPSLRCKACHALRSRINRVLARNGNLVPDWTDVSDEQKKHFYQNFHNLSGGDLLARLQETVSEVKKQATVVSFEGTGEFLDEVDLDRKYGEKQEQLANIKQNTRRFFCAIRQVWLYEDIRYIRKQKDEEEVSRVQKRKVQQIPKEQAAVEDKTKKAKEAKALPDQSKETKLKAGQVKKIQKKVTALNNKKLSVMDLCCKARLENVRDLVPTYVVQSATKVCDEVVAFVAMCDAAVSQEVGDAQALNTRADELQTQIGEAYQRMKTQVEQASAYAQEAAQST